MDFTLKAKTRHGMNKLSQLTAIVPDFDGVWRIAATSDRVGFDLGKSGPWHLLEPAMLDSSVRKAFSQWVHSTDDKNFIMQPNARNQADRPA